MKFLKIAILLISCFACSSKTESHDLNEAQLKEQLRKYVHKLGKEDNELKFMLLKQEVQIHYLEGKGTLNSTENWPDTLSIRSKFKVKHEQGGKENGKNK